MKTGNGTDTRCPVCGSDVIERGATWDPRSGLLVERYSRAERKHGDVCEPVIKVTVR